MEQGKEKSTITHYLDGELQRGGRKPTINSVSMSQRTTQMDEYEMPIVYYSNEAKASIEYLVDKVATEIGWLGLVETTDEGDYLITEIVVPKQRVSIATTEISGEGIAEAAIKLMDEGKDPTKLLYWGHSHVNMGVFPSGQDEDQVEEFLDNVDFFIRGIYNKAGDSKVDVYDVEAGLIHQCVDDMPLNSQLTPELREKFDAAIKDDVNPTRSYKYTGPTYVPPKAGQGKAKLAAVGKSKGVKGKTEIQPYRFSEKQSPISSTGEADDYLDPDKAALEEYLAEAAASD